MACSCAVVGIGSLVDFGLHSVCRCIKKYTGFITPYDGLIGRV
jgi:hypothetical protein